MSKRRDDPEYRPYDYGAAASYWDEREAAQRLEEYEKLFRYQPQNVEAEAALLGALMIDNRLIETVSATLKVDHFYEPIHARVYERILALSAKGTIATPVTIRPYFDGEQFDFATPDETGKRNTTSGYLAQLTGSGAGLIGARQFAGQIIALANLRDVISVTQTVGQAAADTSVDVDPARVIALAEEKLLEISSRMENQGRRYSASFGNTWDAAVGDMDATREGKTTAGITINGYDDWNEVVGPMGDGDFILLAARPSMGKTGMGAAVAMGAAAAGHATDFLSLEMKGHLIGRRMLFNAIYQQGITSSANQLIKGAFTQADLHAMEVMRERIGTFPLQIHDPDMMNVEELDGFIRRRKRAWSAQGRELKLVVVDHLSRWKTARIFRAPHERMSHISDTIKTTARRHGIPIVALAQLSREVERRDDKHPMLIDLRESGSLEEDADTVAFLYRDEYYLARSEPDQSKEAKWNAWQDEMIASRDRVELYSAKRREGDLIRRTGYFFTREQAFRSSAFYQGSSLWAAEDTFDFGGMDAEAMSAQATREFVAGAFGGESTP